MDVFNYVSARL